MVFHHLVEVFLEVFEKRLFLEILVNGIISYEDVPYQAFGIHFEEVLVYWLRKLKCLIPMFQVERSNLRQIAKSLLHRLL